MDIIIVQEVKIKMKLIILKAFIKKMLGIKSPSLCSLGKFEYEYDYLKAKMEKK